MLKEILEIIKEAIVKFFFSRLFVLAAFFIILFTLLIRQLYTLQIVNGENYLSEYQTRTLREITTLGTRGNIYDRNGELLAYNELQYNITISDNNAYDTSSAGVDERNRMLLSLARIIEKYGYSIKSQYKIRLEEDGSFAFTTQGEDELRRFLANIRGKSEGDLLEEDFHISAKDAFLLSKSRYRFDSIPDKYGNYMILSDKIVLDMIHIIYTMRQTAYQRYQTTTLVTGISQECMAEILENKGELKGVDIESVSIRKYNYAPYLSHIIGYTGQVREEQLQELRKTDDSYEANDIVGVWGLEKSLESTLKGRKGKKTVYLNSVGSILEVVSETEASSGNDVYSTISAEDQMAIYHLMEQELAGILCSKISEEFELNYDTDEIKQSQIMIPLKDAYFQLINNNVLDNGHFFSEEAGEAERAIASIFESNKKKKLELLKDMLYNNNEQVLKDFPLDMQAYIVCIYDYLTSKDAGIIDMNSISFKQSEAYKRWRDDSISLYDFIMFGIQEGWLDNTGLNLAEEYSDMESIYGLVVDRVLEYLRNDRNFDKILYKYAISDRVLPGHLLLMALMEQGVLPKDDESYLRLSTGDAHFSYEYLIGKIRSLELTPADLALDPCNGSVVVTDVSSGKVRALVTYPGFDNNKISDTSYFRKCNEDLSLPLLNCATQTQLAPGSTFKPITSVASLEEGAINMFTQINCTGKYEEVTPNIRCWIWPYAHGMENIVAGLKNSCNFFYADLGHRLSFDAEGNYDPALGMERIRKYAEMFGLNEKTGIELDEAEPRMSDFDPERSAMGQANHAYNNVQLARYITAVANNGTLFKLSILDRIADQNGNVIQTVLPAPIGTLELSPITWSAVHTGLREMITEGVAKSVFEGQDIEVAGKTGTAQERKDRGNHSVFVSYAPYQNPIISVSVNIPYGYSSGNAAMLASHVYDYCFNKISLSEILSWDASYVVPMNVSD